MNGLKTSRVLLSSAARSENTAGNMQTDLAATSLRFYLDVSDAPGSGGLTVVVRGYDRVSGNSVELTTGGAAQAAAIGTYVYEMTDNPSADIFGNIMESVSRAVPYQWDALVKHADEASYTYSLSVEIVG
jgi:hypothetical protein